MSRRGDNSRPALRLLLLILLITPFEYGRSFLPGHPAGKFNPVGDGWAQYCSTCKHIGLRHTSEMSNASPCGKGHSTTEVLRSFVCPQCNNEILYRKGTPPRRAGDIQCDNGAHTPKEILARKLGTESDETLKKA